MSGLEAGRRLSHRIITVLAVVIAIGSIALVIVLVQVASTRPTLSLDQRAERVLLDTTDAQKLLPDQGEQEILVNVTGGEVTTTTDFPMTVRADSISKQECKEIYWPSLSHVGAVGADTSSFDETGGYARAFSRAEVMSDSGAALAMFEHRRDALQACDAFSYRITANDVAYSRTDKVITLTRKRMVPSFRLDATLSYTIDGKDYEQITVARYYLVGNVVVTWADGIFPGTDPLPGLDETTADLEQRILQVVADANPEEKR